MNPLGIPDQELKEAVEKVRGSMLRALPDEQDDSHSFSAEFEQKMDRLLRRSNRRRQFIRCASRMAAIFAVVLVSISVWLGMAVSARAAAQNWFYWYFSDSIVYRSEAPVSTHALPEYELTRLPKGYVHSQTVETNSSADEPVRSRAVFCYNAQTDSVLVLQYGFLDESTYHKLSVSQNSHTRERIVLGDTLADLYVPRDAADPHYLFWSDQTSGIFFDLKAHAETAVLLSIAQSVSPVEKIK